jgi:ligand-binding sensor domain-containing protein
MIKLKAIEFVLLVALSFSMYAQQPIIKTFTAQDGLVTNQVRKIYQDSKGFIWIGTLEGISQFNGHQFINYTTATGLPNSVVNDFIEIDGKMLVALGDGSICAIQNGRINSIAKLPWAFSVSSFLKLPDGRLIISTEGSGIYEYKNGMFFKPKQEFPELRYHFLSLFNDTLFFSSTIGGLVFLTKDYRLFDKAIQPFVINSVYKDSHQRFWLCTNVGLSLLALNNDNKIIRTKSLPQQFNRLPATTSNIYCLLETGKDEFWIATTNELIHLTPDGNFTVYTDKDGLAYKLVSTIFCDREKNIWTGTIEGLSRIVRQNNIYTYQTIKDSATNLYRNSDPLEKK